MVLRILYILFYQLTFSNHSLYLQFRAKEETIWVKQLRLIYWLTSTLNTKQEQLKSLGQESLVRFSWLDFIMCKLKKKTKKTPMDGLQNTCFIENKDYDLKISSSI